MKFRITGTLDELRRARALLGETFDVREASQPYLNRGDSTLYRLYIDAELPTDATDPAAGG
ncbi:hypothetical protein [Nocardia camponoti]|uniref:Uncharacterized protein n=1 Tax=Nocardia camponoti TaxID=1616106 RepID=A0A917QV46_9NOCA|nr:hypothetical protein [Nocardia camponoti]GGK68839.1 hypothetical protein GCM10011591_46230 [Nocardia camponoti]